ncbi:Tat pathway signal protein [Rubellimicrobium rubrum]|uniref:Tat pathway signal protein n=1 Tax=Rubellimicrobium rubrum TaxID=2585369 RepID=A0A5C4MTM5_9RHOB|nr:alpha-amylase family protein [Rubellimicrobium rubrum]TNC48710.1 Tat pathway signal protein [Rubellimicrobium rubrum]
MDHAPWYRTTLRWAQTNLTEIDPTRYDAAFWREHWHRTRIQGVIVNAGGIIAYYPSEIPFHHQAETLDGRDLYGEIVAAAREENLAVIARMDSNRVVRELYEAHPDWICVDAEGQPYRQADKFVTCINSPYYSDHLPQVMREIIARSSPDGFADNSWAGLPRTKICHCLNCRQRFAAEGHDLPEREDWDDEAYRAWVAWNYRRRTELWDFNNAVTMEAGGPDCRWMGMLSGEVLNNCNRFIDLRDILSRSEIVMLDHQRRTPEDGFEQNTEAGKRLHELLGWDKLIPESTPQYQLGSPAFRLSSMPPAEVQLWTQAAFAGGIQPWWHHIGAAHEDRRQYRTAEPIFRWHEANQDILVGRTPLARIGVVWSQANHDLHGRDRPEQRTLDPYRGMVRALSRAGLDWLPVEVKDIAQAKGRFDVLVLPNVVVIDQKTETALRAYVEAGGSLVATGETGRRDGHGQWREVPALSDLFGLVPDGEVLGADTTPDPSIEIPLRHSYLRLSPERRHDVYGPQDEEAPAEVLPRHPVLGGLDDTDTLPFGGLLPSMRAEPGTTVLATFIPEFPIYPPETSWMRTRRTEVPAIAVRKGPNGSRLAFVLADLDRCYAREGAFEHAQILSNAVRWALRARPPVEVSAPGGLVAATAYAQEGRWIVHLTSRVVTAPVPGRQEHVIPIGPVELKLHADSLTGSDVELRVSQTRPSIEPEGSSLTIAIERVVGHEVVVISAQ